MTQDVKKKLENLCKPILQTRDTQFLFAQSSYLLAIVYYFVFEIVNLYVVRRQQPSPLPIEQMSLKSKLLVRKIYLSSRHGASLLRLRYLSSGAFVNY